MQFHEAVQRLEFGEAAIADPSLIEIEGVETRHALEMFQSGIADIAAFEAEDLELLKPLQVYQARVRHGRLHEDQDSDLGEMPDVRKCGRAVSLQEGHLEDVIAVVNPDEPHQPSWWPRS